MLSIIAEVINSLASMLQGIVRKIQKGTHFFQAAIPIDSDRFL